MTESLVAAPVFILPLTVVRPADVARMCRELEQVDDFLTQAAVRTPGSPTKLPPSGRKLEQICEDNNLNLLQDDQRAELKKSLQAIKTDAPVMHFSFASEASPQFLQQLLMWVRTNLHPHALLEIGLSPGIVAGCTLRTTNRVFDFSLEHKFKSTQHLLGDALKQLYTQVIPVAAPIAPALAPADLPIEASSLAAPTALSVATAAPATEAQS